MMVPYKSSYLGLHVKPEGGRTYNKEKTDLLSQDIEKKYNHYKLVVKN